MIRTNVLLLAALLTSTTATAQGIVAHSGQECRSVLNKLNSDPHSEAFRWALTYGRVSACGADGAQAIAAILRSRSRGVAAAGYFPALVLQASGVRHPALFDAALKVAADQALPAAVRVGGVQIALAQHDVAYRLPQNLHSPARPPYDRACAFDLIPEYGYRSAESLPADYRTRLLQTMRELSISAENPTAVRRAAQCVEYILTVAEEPEPES